mgnify:FL=1
MLINAVLVCVSLILFPAEKYPTTGTFASDGILKGEDKYSTFQLNTAERIRGGILAPPCRYLYY